MAQLNGIRQESLEQVSNTKKLGEESGASIPTSPTGEAAIELKQRLDTVKQQADTNLAEARAGSTKADGTQQDGEEQTNLGLGQILSAQNLLLAAVPIGLFLGPIAGLAAAAAGGGMFLMEQGQANKAQGEQKIAEATPIASQASNDEIQGQSDLNEVATLRGEAEAAEAEQAATEGTTDSDAAKDKGYYVADAGTAGASSDGGDNELVAERLTSGEKAVNEQLGISTDSDTEEGGIATGDKTTIASRLKGTTEEINNLLGADKKEKVA
jgi:hypothetical protein